jgi:hypothetical protein
MVPECRHIKTSGGKSGSTAAHPRLVGQPCCYFETHLSTHGIRNAPMKLNP